MKINNNKGIIVLLIVIIAILSTLCVLFATGTISFKSNNVDNESITENNNNENSNSNTNEGSNILSNAEAKSILASLDTKYYDYYVDAGVYCGSTNGEDIIYPYNGEESWKGYIASTQFKTIDEIKSYLESMMVDGLIPHYLKNNKTSESAAYIEKNGKLYCEIPYKGGWIDRQFNKETEYSIKSIQENKIDAQITFVGQEMGESEKNYNIDITITKSSSGNWLVSSYEIKK